MSCDSVKCYAFEIPLKEESIPNDSVNTAKQSKNKTKQKSN